MKSIKPGRGPSMLSGIMCIAVGIFGVIWTVMAVNIGAGIFSLFGVVFIAMAIVMAIYNFKNATSKNRYSTFDITDGHEEPDPLNERFGERKSTVEKPDEPGNTSAFCPYCGAKVDGGYEYCNRCGKKLP